MISCTSARELLLTADLEELVPGTATELGRHLSTCAACRAAAARVIAGERAMAGVLARVEQQPAPAARPETVIELDRRPRHVWTLAVPLALAASIGVFLILRPDAALEPDTEGPQLNARSDHNVTAPPGQSVAVFSTDNPRITIYWFF